LTSFSAIGVLRETPYPEAAMDAQPQATTRRLLIVGPPCSGKTTLALQLAQPGELVLDRDRIAVELGSDRTHMHTTAITRQAEQRMRAELARLAHHPQTSAVVVRSTARPAQQSELAAYLGAELTRLDPGMHECLRRARAARRPHGTYAAIRRWYDKAAAPTGIVTANPCMDCGEPAASVRCDRCCTRLRNGRPWRTLQAQVFAEETHCWICGRWVDQDLPPEHAESRTADHIHQLRDGGPALDRNGCRLAHRNCNTARTNKSRGHRARESLSVDLSTI
jgi:hypothetical protein